MNQAQALVFSVVICLIPLKAPAINQPQALVFSVVIIKNIFVKRIVIQLQVNIKEWAVKGEA
jgi:hypothetical protein